MDFVTIKNNYDRGLWNIVLVRMAVKKGFITKEQYCEITGFVYPAIK